VLAPDDARQPVAVISSRFWQETLGGRDDVLGRPLLAGAIAIADHRQRRALHGKRARRLVGTRDAHLMAFFVLHAVRLTLSRYLALGLEFQLAADVVDTAISPEWQHIGQLAAIAAIRTVLNYFLGQEMREERDSLTDAARLTQQAKA
jgi:uncharacterized membrane protein